MSGHPGAPKTSQIEVIAPAPDLTPGYTYGAAKYSQAMPKRMIAPASGAHTLGSSVQTPRSLVQARSITQATPNAAGQCLMHLNAPSSQL